MLQFLYGGLRQRHEENNVTANNSKNIFSNACMSNISFSKENKINLILYTYRKFYWTDIYYGFIWCLYSWRLSFFVRFLNSVWPAFHFLSRSRFLCLNKWNLCFFLFPVPATAESGKTKPSMHTKTINRTKYFMKEICIYKNNTKSSKEHK